VTKVGHTVTQWKVGASSPSKDTRVAHSCCARNDAANGVRAGPQRSRWQRVRSSFRLPIVIVAVRNGQTLCRSVDQFRGPVRRMTASPTSKRSRARVLPWILPLWFGLWQPTHASGTTLENFDSCTTPAVCQLGQWLPAPAPGPLVEPGGPQGQGCFLRLASTPAPDQNTITCPVSDAGAYGHVVAQFDFRMTPISGRADGLGLALLNTAPDHYPGTAPVAPAQPYVVSEDLWFADSLGVGFDIYRNDGLGDINNNHVSVHFNGIVTQVDVTPFGIDLASGQWIHAAVDVRATATPPNVTVTLTPQGGTAQTVIDSFPVPGLVPYEARVHLGARSGGQTAFHDIDNIDVTFLEPVTNGPGVLAFTSASFTAIEGGGGTAFITVARSGGSLGQVTVDYTTTDQSAQAGADYTTTSGTLTFADRETLKYFTIPILNDSAPEPDETFRLDLQNSTAGATLGDQRIATVTIKDVDDDPPQLVGQWSPPTDWGITAIHLHLLPSGLVLGWEDRNDLDNVILWDPATGAVATANRPDYDLFCSGHAFLADGRLLVTGGQTSVGPIETRDGVGLVNASTYDPRTDCWARLPDMNGRRWYPTNTILANGDMLVTSGSFDTSFIPNPQPQVWQPASSTWRDLTGARITLPLYPFMFQAPNGAIFSAGPQQTTRYLDSAGVGAWSVVGNSNFGYRDYGSAVMLDSRVLIIGGTADPARPPNLPPTASAEIIDLQASTPVWTSIAPMTFARRHHVASLLPDGTVLVCGGTSAPGFKNATGAVFAPELWNPQTNTWTLLAPNQVRRLYHSTALLLPDGRVLSAGGGQPGSDGEDTGGVPLSEFGHTDFEVFSPPYLFKGPRPVVTSAPATATYGQSLFIQTPDAAAVAKVTLIRLPSVTHAFDQNQRLTTLSSAPAAGGLNVSIPVSPNVVPPGHYMLFLVSGNGVPSMARILQVGTGPFEAPTTGPTCTPRPTSTATVTTTPTTAATPLAMPCAGDCDNSREVTIDEILVLVNIALGTQTNTQCPRGIPLGVDVNVALIIGAVGNALDGCPLAQFTHSIS
jgi:galactose oxidase-like protein/Calx-beta domain-containing protein/glyoxal oxidase-like protein/Kelch motif protein